MANKITNEQIYQKIVEVEKIIQNVAREEEIIEKEARGLLMFAFSNNVLDSVKIPEIKSRITKIIAGKLGVNIGFNL